MKKLLLASFVEQGRRENEHNVPYTQDQTIRAIQDRLSRYIGHKHAYKAKLRKLIKEVLDA